MEHWTLMLDLDDDGAVRLSSNTLGGAHVAVMRNGQPERVIQVRCVHETEIEQYVRGVLACDRSGAWSGLDSAREVAQEAERRSADVSAELAKRLHVPIAERIPDLAALLADVDELMPLIDDAEQRHSDALAAWGELKAMYREAAAIERKCAAHAGHQQQPRIEIEGDDDV